MGCIQSYFKRAHTAGLSPSSTQDSNSNKTGGDDAGSGVHAASTTGTVEKDKVSADFTSTGDRPPEEPESNDTSYGVEATAVRTLAASTGTVAILGTTAKTPQSRRESRVSNLDNEEADNRVDKKDVVKPDSINVEVKDEHKNGGTNLVKKLDEVVNSVEKIETVINSSTITTTVDKIESVIKSSTETKTKVIESPPTKEVVVVEVEHSSKVENVEKPVENPRIQTTTALVEDVKVDDAVSPLEDGGFSESNFAEDEDDRPTTVLEIEKAQSNTEVRTSISEISENEDTKGMDDEISSEQLKTNSLSDTTLSESFNVGLDGIKQAEDEEGATPVVEDVGKSELSEALAAVDSVVELKRSSDKNGVLENDFEKGAELKNKVVDASSNEISQIESKNSEADSKKEVNEEPVVKTVANTKVESAPSNRNSVVDQVLGNDIKVLGEEGLKEVENKVENGLSSVVVNGVPEVEDDKMSAAATTIQASFRGYQTRQQNAAKVNESVETNGKNSNINQVDISEQHNGLPSNNVEVVKVMQLTEIVDEGVEKKLESIIASKEGLIEKVDDKLDAAATAIQASFRGYQTRQNIKKDDNKTEKSVGKEEDSINYTIQGVEVDQTEKETIESVEAGSEKGDSIEKSKTEKKEELVDKTKSVDASHKEKETANKTEPDNVSKKVEESLDKLNSEEAIKTVEKIAVTEDIPVAQNSNSVDAQVEKVPGSVEQTEKVSPKNTQLETVKNSQESSESSSFDSVQNVSLDPVTSVSIKDKSEVAKLDSSDKEVENVEEVKTESKKLKENGSISLEETKEKLKDEEKESLAATTIQANFRGYQARQNLGKKVGEVEESGNKEEALKSGEGEEKGEVEDVKVSTAATKIQAGFRGYQTRKKLKEDEDETVVVEALTSRTPELVESVREEVDEICKRAVETTENLISQGLHKFHKSGSVEEEGEEEEEEEEARKNEGIVDKSDVVDVAKETIEAVVEKAEKIADEKLNSAATTIQASFRGFQARQNLEKNTTDIDGLPDFPPSTEDEDYTPVPDDDDLPLPDLEALESSYSEEMATEPLLPPPPTASGPPPPVTITTNLHNLTIPETEEVSEASTEVGTIEEDLKSLQRPQECDELDRLERDSTDGESSLSSAATKIQAGVRGYLTRKQINQGQAGTTSTSGPSLLSDDRSLGDFSSSREEDGPVRSMISTEEETEVGRHSGSSPPGVKRTVMKKRMSLDSRIAGQPAPLFSRTSRAMSVSAVREDASNEEVWEMLQSELSCAATKIQSNFRGYQARKQLRRGDAVQMPTTSSSTTPGSNSLDGSVSRMGHVTEHTRSSGEYHDMIALTPPNIPNIGEEEDEEKVEEKEEGKTTSQQPNGSRDEDAMVKRRQDESRPQKESEEEAAAKIQAGFRGYKVRRNMNAQDVATATSGSATSCATSDDAKSPQQATTASSNNHSNAEIEAATKIQAGFRGFKTRQELKSSKSSADSK